MVTFFTLIGLMFVVLGPAGAFFFVFSPLLGVGMTAAGIVLVALCFFGALVQFLRNGASETSWLGFFFGFAALGALGALGYFAFLNPLHDITTDVHKAPLFLHPAYPFPVGKGAEYLDVSLRLNRDYAETNAGTQLQAYPNFETTVAKAAPADVYAAALKTVHEQLPAWKEVLNDPKALHAEWEVEDPIFHGILDVVLEVRSDPKHPYDAPIALRARNRIEAPDFGLGFFRLRDLKVRLNLAMEPLEQKATTQRSEFEAGLKPGEVKDAPPAPPEASAPAAPAPASKPAAPPAPAPTEKKK